MDRNKKAQAVVLLKELMVVSNFYPGHIKLTESIGLVEAMVLQQHVYFQSVKGDKYHGTRKKIELEFRLSLRIQRPIECKLIALGFLVVERKPKSSYNYYTVNTDLVNDFINLPYQERLSYVEKAYATINSDGASGGSDNPLLGGSDNLSPLKLDKNRIDKDTDNKLSVMDFSKVHDEKIKKSRLQSKDEPTVATSDNLAARTNNTVAQKQPAIDIPDRTIRCIKYWNSFSELMEHRINLTSPSKTLLQTVKLLGSFFAGNFLDVVQIPRGFKDHSWFNSKPTEDQFYEIVDDFVFCLRSPDVKPVMNGKRYNILEFLRGNNFVGEEGIPSLMLTYCFGEYKTLVVDKHPKTTALIKTIWEKYIGKYNDTPSTERAFVTASNICHLRYTEKRKEEDGWIPAMNDYQPAGIAKQIILNKAEWFKKEKKSPEIMGGSFFTNIIRKYDYNKRTGDMVI